ncbi:sporulation protein YunB [Fictibacillus sp. 5RED26]|uniref:sporulation protein YunB n=1 Tax=Fictibacillus TaxID=1329200 RepID=UPI0018CD17F3|nr:MULTISPECIES: sporulation protein YunB [unclassified Fictibacillus]MBH0158045.1 sporulation protein YunB [Fictibacillus sp. 5RED26]MBH0163648.1 sporulation protein YunB [Fictibacillus sp. 7GRE50]MBH0175783.1 sporulation protein YunB [Fictibacillus sp. 23RED33]
MLKRRKMKLRKGPLPFRFVLLISFILFTFITIQGLWLVNKGIEPTLMLIAQKKTEEIAALAISEAIDNEILGPSEMNDIIEYKTDTEGNVVFAGINQSVVNQVANQSQKVVQKYLKEIEEGKAHEVITNDELGITAYKNEPGVIMEIPLGQATRNSLLANLGPKIPIKFMLIGEANTDIEEKIENSGINNTWINIDIVVTVKTRIVIPFATETTVVKRPIKITAQFIKGEVPVYYNQSGDPIQPTVPITPDLKEKESHDELEPSEDSPSEDTSGEEAAE